MYTKPLQFKTMPTLKDTKGYIAVSMKAKEALVHKSAFPKLSINLAEPIDLFSGVAHKKVMEKVVSQALMTQAIMKTSRSDKINFWILQMI